MTTKQGQFQVNLNGAWNVATESLDAEGQRVTKYLKNTMHEVAPNKHVHWDNVCQHHKHQRLEEDIY